ncbi:hypothetical protein [Actinacidiphila glaucinigra]|uniref:hypothetical protein n=1 Tax=Actinacidiphila glaucinigra TaxID=235986 RepID=UPI002E377E3E|nr:hypothetical protein [Actinacidiphila glaucinigra]
MSEQTPPQTLADAPGQNTSPCCAAIAELQRRVQQRAAERAQADGSATPSPASPDPTPGA